MCPCNTNFYCFVKVKGAVKLRYDPGCHLNKTGVTLMKFSSVNGLGKCYSEIRKQPVTHILSTWWQFRICYVLYDKVVCTANFCNTYSSNILYNFLFGPAKLFSNENKSLWNIPNEASQRRWLYYQKREYMISYWPHNWRVQTWNTLSKYMETW